MKPRKHNNRPRAAPRGQDDDRLEKHLRGLDDDVDTVRPLHRDYEHDGGRIKALPSEQAKKQETDLKVSKLEVALKKLQKDEISNQQKFDKASEDKKDILDRKADLEFKVKNSTNIDKIEKDI